MSLLKNFIKYQSLGNDFIIFDWYKKPAVYMHNELHDIAWRDFVMTLCDRHYGVGADGVLIITNCQKMGMPEVQVFNADGSQAESCLNGLRCTAHYLVTQYTFPEKFSIKLSDRIIDCSVQKNKHVGVVEVITTSVGSATCGDLITLDGPEVVQGFHVDVGNPHFIIFAQKNLDYVRQHGPWISTHPSFERGANVEFVWEEELHGEHKRFTMLVHERGCGITRACSSGAAALVGLLYEQGGIVQEEVIVIAMLGGSVKGWINGDGCIVLQAHAHMVFKGVCEGFEHQCIAQQQVMVQP